MTFLEQVFTEIIRKFDPETRFGLMYSGGLDSSIIAKILLKTVKSDFISFITVGAERSYDLINAKKGAEKLGIELKTCILTHNKVRDSIKDLKKFKYIQTPKDLSIAIPLYLGLRKLVKENFARNIFLGQGADELFGGYNRYELLFKKKLEKQIKQQMKFDLSTLRSNQLKMEKEIANNVGVDLIYPYLDEQLIEYAQRLPYNKLLRENEFGKIIRKVYLREVAANLTLPKDIINQRKKAIQYGSNTIKLMRVIATEDGFKNIRIWFQKEFKIFN
ncbi:asparagine synthase C-terminal domain-containing protein [Candidatus Hodarchaeum mangrovi]